MDKPSTSGHTQELVSSPVVSSTPKKQKSTAMQSPNTPRSKIRKTGNEQNHQDPNTHDQNLTQGIDPSQLINDNPLACISSQTKSQSLTVSSTSDVTKARFKEGEGEIERALIKQKKLRRKLKTLDESADVLNKDCQAEMKVQEDISEKQSLFANFRAVIRDRITDLENILKVLRERKEQLDKIFNDVILKHYEEHKDLNERVKLETLKMKNHVGRLESKKKEVLSAVDKAERLCEKLIKLSQIGNGIIKRQKECELILRKNQQRHSKDMNQIDDFVRGLETDLNKVRGEKVILASKTDENSKRKSELLSECEALELSVLQRKEQIEHLKSSIGDSEEKLANMKIKIDESKSANLAIISKRDSELSVYRKQIEDLILEHSEASKTLSNCKSSNETLSNSITQSVDDIKKLEKISHDKDCEILREEVSDVTELNKDLSAEAQSLKASLIDKKEQIAQEMVDFKTFSSGDQSDQSGIETQAKIADVTQQSKDVAERISKVCEQIEAEALESSRKKTMCIEENEKLDEQLAEIQKTLVICQQEIDQLDSENNTKVQELSQSSTQCQRAGHEKQMIEQSQEIDALRIEISAVKTDCEEENMRTTEMTRRKNEEPEAEFEEFKTEVADLEKRTLAAEKVREDLKKRFKEAQVSSKADSNTVPRSLNSSPPVSMIFTRNRSQPASSTPQHSPQAGLGLWDNFGFGELSDESSINSSNVIEDAERQYAKFVETNKTDAAKLSQTKQPTMKS